ncbi:MAG: AAA family ATPase [Treponema sp.]|jgi:predicted ATPase|nr:AAA family ATPase [Treponema sp.]
MIKGLALTNFKSIGKTLIANDEEIIEGKLEFAPLTIFCGKNSSGKSTVLQSILLLAQTLQNNVPSQTLVLNGPMVKLGGVNDIKSEFLTSKDISIDIDFFNPKPTKGASASLEFREKYYAINNKGFIEEEIFIEELKRNFKYFLSNDLNQIIFTINSKTLFNIKIEDIEWELNTGLSKNVKDLMDKYHVNYSMTTYSVDNIYRLVINKRIGNEWAIFVITESDFIVVLNKNKIIKNKLDKIINNINIRNQNINLSISFFNKKINDISNIIPLINQLYIKDEYLINNIKYYFNFTASRITKYKEIDAKYNNFNYFTFKMDNTTKKMINIDNLSLIGLRLNHFIPKEFVTEVNLPLSASNYINLFVDSWKNLKIKQFNNRFVFDFNNSIRYIKRCFNDFIDISDFLIPEDIEINNERIFHQYMNRSITKLKNINKKELFNKFFLSVSDTKDKKHNSESDKYIDTEKLPVHIQDAINNITDFFQHNLIYIGPLREEPHLQYDGYIANTTNIGIKGENFAGALYQNKNKIINYIKPDCFEQENKKIDLDKCILLDAVKEWLIYIGVASDVIISFNGRYGYELKIKSFGKNKTNDLTNVGVGVSQILPIILTCLLAPEESTIIIEQPELHLHPAMQSRLADFFVSAILCNKQLIIETHSEYIINRLRLRIINWPSEKSINDSVKIYFTDNLKEDYKDYKKGNTIFRPLNINEYAAMSDWPDGFFDESSKIADEIIKAATKKWEENKDNKQ